MFQHPEIASQVTLLPVDILGVDAAILFADILTLPSQMGFKINFSKKSGPIIFNPVETMGDLKKIHDFEGLPYLKKTIALANRRLPGHIPLVGFAGSPFTVLCYLMEAGSSTNLYKTFHFAVQESEAFHKLMRRLTQNTIAYLNFQKEAGIRVFQLFDTWAGILRPADYARWVLPYVREIFQKVDLPSIYYVKNSGPLLEWMDQCGADFLSVCHGVVLGHNRILKKTTRGIQGNLFNGLLYADDRTLRKETREILEAARQYKRYIFNLSHGVFPDTPVDKLKLVVETVHRFR